MTLEYYDYFMMMTITDIAAVVLIVIVDIMNRDEEGIVTLVE